MKTDFDKVGKRMPYTVPEDFFDRLEADILQQVVPVAQQAPVRRTGLVPMWVKTVAAVAAMVVLVAGATWLLHDRSESPLPDVEQAFANLSSEDQDYILAVYQEDLFLDETY